MAWIAFGTFYTKRRKTYRIVPHDLLRILEYGMVTALPQSSDAVRAVLLESLEMPKISSRYTLFKFREVLFLISSSSKTHRMSTSKHNTNVSHSPQKPRWRSNFTIITNVGVRTVQDL